ncbi:MAG TPA: DUF3142 domain-containing protein [Luteibacter sp.]|uniref:DUF3142 domain-containing protein n=1 Tax=Luteibacter sp. TaxID=1886636 RepID=UPI002CE58894|nr:DUF3142 domain-containing protein [Luteibacter sp.]HVI55526.1 DUF3142 domain-containing protein [Luteibacter sp.]
MGHVLRSLAIVAIAVVLVTACGRAPVPLTHDAYVWQRQWTPALREAVASSSDLVRDWRVLVAQADRNGVFHRFAPDREALARSGRPVVLVVRIDGRLASFDAQVLADRIAALTAGWPSTQLAGIEIDYDCPTSRLPAYTAFLAALRPRLGTLSLSITALPTWLGSRDLDPLLAQPDESVLQVHAVQAPQAGLFDPAVADRWVDEFATHTRKPFRVALPTYGSRVSWNEDGSLLAVESEQAALAAGATSAELYAAPDALMAFVAQLSKDRPRGLVGVVWFRLPTVDDTRAWSLATWRGVVTGHLDTRPLVMTLQPGPSADAPSDVILENAGATDVAPPSRVALPASCELADGIDGYRLQRHDAQLELVAERARPIPAHTRRAIGWARCKPGTPLTLSPTPVQGMPVS